VVESDGKTFPLSSIEGHVEEEKNDKLDRYNEDMYEQLKAQSIRLSNLTDTVESLQSQVQQLQETTRLHKRHKTTSVRKKSTSNNGTKTKKKTKRRGNIRGRKK
jgi:hypothetical protein